MQATNFSDLKPGDQAQVCGFHQGSNSYRKKLLAMGLTPGTIFSFLRSAPLGDPVEINVRGFFLSLRKEEAQLIKIELLSKNFNKKASAELKVDSHFLPMFESENIKSTVKKNVGNPCCIALVGNPNCGKSVIFNALTGSRQRIGNWPGVTVEKKCGITKINHEKYTVFDLPGIYSLDFTDEALDEKIAHDFIASQQVNCIVNIIDGSNLERNLYLTLELLEKNIPMVVAVNMLDILEKTHSTINLEKLSQLLNCPVIGLVARENIGIQQLQKIVFDITHQKTNAMQKIIYYQDPSVSELEVYDGDHDIWLADKRYAWAHEICQQVVKKNKQQKKILTATIDRVVLNRYIGIPLFLFIMYLVFVFAINLGGAFQDFFDISSESILVNGSAYLLNLLHAPDWLIALLSSGVGKGVNTTVTFIPVIASMFLFLTFLEDSGYMARAAFVMDRFMRFLGLPGKAFIPMIIGFGCNVPAVMSSRTLSHPRDRILTVLMMPFMSCGARLAIFAVFAAAFFPSNGGTIIFALYLLGITAAIVTGFLVRKLFLKDDFSPLIMEMPAYHLPRFSTLLRHTWQKLRNFIFRAGTVIVPVCMLLGVLNTINAHGKIVSHHEPSLLMQTGEWMTPILKPIGIEPNNWPATVGLLTGIVAKEVVIGTLNTLYSQSGNLKTENEKNFNLKTELHEALVSVPNNLISLKDAWKNPFKASEAPHAIADNVLGVMVHYFKSKTAAFSYLLFVLLYFPCISTFAAMRREIGAKWAYFSLFWSLSLAYGLSFLFFQLMQL